VKFLTDEEVLGLYDLKAREIGKDSFDSCSSEQQDTINAAIRMEVTCPSWKAMEQKAQFTRLRSMQKAIPEPTHYLDFSRPWPKKPRRKF
jgi:hypothetical protein